METSEIAQGIGFFLLCVVIGVLERARRKEKENGLVLTDVLDAIIEGVEKFAPGGIGTLKQEIKAAAIVKGVQPELSKRVAQVTSGMKYSGGEVDISPETESTLAKTQPVEEEE